MGQTARWTRFRGSVASRSHRRDSERRPRWHIDDVLVRTDLVSLLDQVAEPATYATHGRRWHCPVPEHEDRRASVTMHTDRRGHERWRCWSGDDAHRGDAIDLVMLTQRTNRAEAIEWLANRAGLVPNQPLPPVTRPKPPARPSVVPLDPAVADYVRACERILSSPAARPVREWLEHRGLGEEVIRANHVGADPGRTKLRRRRGLPYGSTIAATFPALDQAGNIRYVQTRYLEPTERDKYDNPAAALGSNPRLSWTRPVGTEREGLMLVCEGIPDALTAAQAGFHSVAILGAQAPDASVAARLATKATRDSLELVVVVDHDDAGRRWGQRLGELLADHDLAPHVVQPAVEGHDLNDWARLNPGWAEQIISISAIGAEHAGPDPTRIVEPMSIDLASGEGM